VRVALGDPGLVLTIGRAAFEAHDWDPARAAIAPLIVSDSPHGRPTRRACLLMADIEETEGNLGAVREWLARAARAPRDKAWVADGVISDRWAPVSPSGTLDAFVWRTPDERLAPYVEPPPVKPEPPVPPQIVAPPPQAVAPGVLAPPAPTPVEPPRRTPPLRSGVIIDPATMAPDDPGPGEPSAESRSFPLYASE
jgi:HemY protein